MTLQLPMALVSAGAIEKVIVDGSERAGIFRNAVSFTVTRPAEMDGEPVDQQWQHDAAIFSLWTEAELRAYGFLPIVPDEQPDDEVLTGLVSSFEVMSDHVAEHFQGIAREPDDLANRLNVLVERRCRLAAAAEAVQRAEGVAFNGHVAQIRRAPEEDLTFITGASVKAFMAKLSNQPFSVSFRMADNVDVDLSADQMIALGQAAFARVDALHDACAAIKDQIRAAGAVTEPLSAETYQTKRAAVLAIDVS